MGGPILRLADTLPPSAQAAVWYSDDREITRRFARTHERLAELVGVEFVEEENPASSRDFLRQKHWPTVVQLSMHAQSDTETPNANRLLFSATDTLYGYELAGARLDMQLLVLAACETSLGQTRIGEGTLSLQQSLQEAGAQRVLSTLWQVPQVTSAAVVERFYVHLAAGLPFDLALQRAKLDLLQQPDQARWRFPGFWAGMVLY
jgi:CHAT domain-containing protein